MKRGGVYSTGKKRERETKGKKKGWERIMIAIDNDEVR